MHLLILGGTSFIGKNVATHFFKNTNNHIQTFGSADIDLTNSDSIEKIKKLISAETVIIFCSTISRLQDDSLSAFYKNVAMANHVASALASSNFKQLIFFSSIDVYGRPPSENPLTENSPINPFGYYGLAKYVSERILLNELDANKLAILRLPGVFSLENHDPSALGKIFTMLKNNETVFLSGGGKQLRTYLCTLEINLTLEQIIRENWSGLLNLAFTKSSCLYEIAHTIKKVLGSSSRILDSASNGTEFDIFIDTNRANSEFTNCKVELIEYLEEKECYI